MVGPQGIHRYKAEIVDLQAFSFQEPIVTANVEDTLK